MIKEEIKNANIEAMRNKDANLRAIYSVIINKIMQAEINARTTGAEVGDAEVVKIIQKTIKELEEEAENYKKIGNTAEADKITNQKTVLEKYLPQMLGFEEIKKIILSLEDKTVPNVMRHFKTNYNGKVDMRTVSDVMKNI